MAFSYVKAFVARLLSSQISHPFKFFFCYIFFPWNPFHTNDIVVWNGTKFSALHCLDFFFKFYWFQNFGESKWLNVEAAINCSLKIVSFGACFFCMPGFLNNINFKISYLLYHLNELLKVFLGPGYIYKNFQFSRRPFSSYGRWECSTLHEWCENIKIVNLCVKCQSIWKWSY